jgi:dienelactone hydrolase
MAGGPPLSILVENVSFESEGYKLFGRIYRPNKPGRFPAVAICHGYPGDNKNMDLAEELALNGITTMIFYYRGAWGSEGTYSFKGFEPSTRDAIEYLISLPFVDPRRVGLIGYSMGAIPLAARLRSDPSLKTGIFISPAANISTFASEDVMDTIIPVFIEMAEGKLNGLNTETLKADLSWALDNQNPIEMIRDARVPVMVVVGSSDQLTPPELCRALYEAANEPKNWVLIEGADHAYADHRIPLIKAVLDWLKEHL